MEVTNSRDGMGQGLTIRQTICKDEFVLEYTGDIVDRATVVNLLKKKQQREKSVPDGFGQWALH
jgi:hypothetical protein